MAWECWHVLIFPHCGIFLLLVGDSEAKNGCESKRHTIARVVCSEAAMVNDMEVDYRKTESWLSCLTNP